MDRFEESFEVMLAYRKIADVARAEARGEQKW